MAGFATSTSYAGHSTASVKHNSKLTYKPDHPMGSGQGGVLIAFVQSEEFESTAINLVVSDVAKLGNFWD